MSPAGSDHPVRTSVVICTRNRASALDACLASVTAEVRTDAEVLVVDNGSTDATPEVLARWVDRAGVRTVHEPVAGLSRARNVGVDQARGELVAFLDDDVSLHPGWHRHLLAFFDEEPDMDGLAGRIVLAFPDGRPRWLHPELDTWYAAVDLGERRRPLEPDEQPFGANMAVRAVALARIGGFDETLGYSDRRLMGSEETDLFDRLRAEGGRLGYDPQVAVHHHIGAERLHLRWVVRRTFAQGRTSAALAARSAGPDEMRRRARTAAGRALLRGWGGSAWRVATQRPRRAALAAVAARRAQQMGNAVESRRLARGA